MENKNRRVPSKIEEIQGVYFNNRSTALNALETILAILPNVPPGRNEKLSARMIGPTLDSDGNLEWEVRLEVEQRYPDL